LGDRVSILKDGEVQQVGTPREVYREPANRFVGGFLGAPPMTLLGGRCEKGRLVLPVGSLPWPDGHRAHDGILEVGVRPEDVHPASSREVPAEGAVRFDARVELVEWLGSETWAHVDVPNESDGGSVRLVARVGSTAGVRVGDRLVLEIDADRLHLFDAGNGRRIPGNG
jgi:multiple sugar transport system ATP-binding protein